MMRHIKNTRRQVVCARVNLLIRPFFFLGRVGYQPVNGFMNALAIGGLVFPQIDRNVLSQPRQKYKTVQIHVGIIPGKRPGQFVRLTSIELQLTGKTSFCGFELLFG